MTKSYDDIINLPRHVSPTRPQMPIINRSAQFAPFAALTGHEAAVQETARLTDQRIELDEYLQDALNEKLRLIADRLKEQPQVKITYFQPDAKKDGGSYITTVGNAKKIDEYERLLILSDGTVIPMDEILDAEVSLRRA